MPVIQYPPSPLAEKIQTASLRHSEPRDILNRIAYDDGTAQIQQRLANWLVRENFVLFVSRAERDAVLDYALAQSGAWFHYQRHDLGFVYARFVVMPGGGMSPRDSAGKWWTLPIAIEYYRGGRSGYWHLTEAAQVNNLVTDIIALTGVSRVGAVQDADGAFIREQADIPAASGFNEGAGAASVVFQVDGDIHLRNAKLRFPALYTPGEVSLILWRGDDVPGVPNESTCPLLRITDFTEGYTGAFAISDGVSAYANKPGTNPLHVFRAPGAARINAVARAGEVHIPAADWVAAGNCWGARSDSADAYTDANTAFGREVDGLSLRYHLTGQTFPVVLCRSASGFSLIFKAGLAGRDVVDGYPAVLSMSINGQQINLARGADTGGNKFYIYNGALANLREAQDEVVAITLNGAIWEFVIVTQEGRSSQTADVEIPAAKWVAGGASCQGIDNPDAAAHAGGVPTTGLGEVAGFGVRNNGITYPAVFCVRYSPDNDVFIWFDIPAAGVVLPATLSFVIEGVAVEMSKSANEYGAINYRNSGDATLVAAIRTAINAVGSTDDIALSITTAGWSFVSDAARPAGIPAVIAPAPAAIVATAAYIRALAADPFLLPCLGANFSPLVTLRDIVLLRLSRMPTDAEMLSFVHYANTDKELYGLLSKK